MICARCGRKIAFAVHENGAVEHIDGVKVGELFHVINDKLMMYYPVPRLHTPVLSED